MVWFRIQHLVDHNYILDLVANIDCDHHLLQYRQLRMQGMQLNTENNKEMTVNQKNVFIFSKISTIYRTRFIGLNSILKCHLSNSIKYVKIQSLVKLKNEHDDAHQIREHILGRAPNEKLKDFFKQVIFYVVSSVVAYDLSTYRIFFLRPHQTYSNIKRLSSFFYWMKYKTFITSARTCIVSTKS